MRFKLSNIAKVKEADLVIDGITVIAGGNNTGKSTIGRSLFCLFNALNNTREKIDKEKILFAERAASDFLAYTSLSEYGEGKIRLGVRFHKRTYGELIRTIATDIVDFYKKHNSISVDDVIKLSSKNIEGEGVPSSRFSELFSERATKIVEYVCVDDYVIIQEIATSLADSVYCSQINYLGDLNSMGRIEAEIKNKVVALNFLRNNCVEVIKETELNKKAIYIDNPSLLSNLTANLSFNSVLGIKRRSCGAIDDMLLDSLSKSKNKPEVGAIDRYLAKEKLKEIYQILNEVVSADVIMSDKSYSLREHNTQFSVDFGNISMGIRAFVTIKMLLESGGIKEKDVLILDEPEIHLHPQWQVLFAHLIVLLQKAFDLSVLVTTHSHFFVDALNLYTKKYGTDSTAHYYLSSLENNQSVFSEVTDCKEKLYEQMAVAVNMLDALRESME